MKHYDPIWRETYEDTEPVDSSELSDKTNNKMSNNLNGLFMIDWMNFKSALISGLITGVLGIAGYIIGVGDIFKLDVHTLLNVFSLSALTTVVSILKSFLTTNAGNFVGTTNIAAAKK